MQDNKVKKPGGYACLQSWWRCPGATCWWIGLPVLLIAAGVAWVAVKFVRPAPPTAIVITAGAPGSSSRDIAAPAQRP